MKYIIVFLCIFVLSACGMPYQARISQTDSQSGEVRYELVKQSVPTQIHNDSSAERLDITEDEILISRIFLSRKQEKNCKPGCLSVVFERRRLRDFSLASSLELKYVKDFGGKIVGLNTVVAFSKNLTFFDNEFKEFTSVPYPDSTLLNPIVAFSENGRWIYVGGSVYDSVKREWKTVKGELLKRLVVVGSRFIVRSAPLTGVVDIAPLDNLEKRIEWNINSSYFYLSEDETKLLVKDRSNKFFLLDTTTGEIVDSWTRDREVIHHLNWSYNRVFSAKYRDEGFDWSIWQISPYKTIAEGNWDSPNNPVFSESEEVATLYNKSTGQIRIIDLKDGKELGNQVIEGVKTSWDWIGRNSASLPYAENPFSLLIMGEDSRYNEYQLIREK